jgi:cytochrome b
MSSEQHPNGEVMRASSERVQVWDLALRLFHWTLVIAIAVAFLSSEEDSAFNDWHVLSGWVAAVLIVFRLAWGFIGGEHSRFGDFIRPSRIPDHLTNLARGHGEPSLGHSPLAAVAVVILLALIAAVVWTGAFGGEAAEELHELIAWVLLAMVALHVVAVVLMSLLERENLVRAMVTGDKPAIRHPGAVDARKPGTVAWLLGAVVVGATSYLIVQYDPDAFALRGAESFEHRADPSGSREATFEEGEDG